MSALPLVYLAAAPLGTVAPVRVRDEWSALLQAANRSGRDLRLEGVNPASVAELTARRRTGGVRPLLHVAAHGAEGGLELEAPEGTAQIVSAVGLAHAVVAFDPQLIVLNGCDTEPLLGELRRARLACPAIGCDGFLGDSTAVRYTDALYGHLFANGDIAAAHTHACQQLVEHGVGSPYHCAGTGLIEDLSAGAVSVVTSFVDVQRRATATERLVGRDSVLARAYESIGNSLAHVTWVSGPPLSGVSRVLRALCERYAWCMERDPSIVDLRTWDRERDVERLIADVLEPGGDRPLGAVLEDAGVLLAIDHWDILDPDDARRVWDAVAQLSPLCRSHVLVGSSPAAARVPSAERLSLEPLSIPDAVGLLTRELGDHAPAEVEEVATALARWPGRLVIAADDLCNGASAREVIDGSRAGDVRAGYGLVVRGLLRDADVEGTMQALTMFGGVVPRTLLAEAVAALWCAGAGEDDATSRFQIALTILREADAIRLEMRQQPAAREALPEAWVGIDADVLAVARRELPALLPTPRRNLATTAADIAVRRLAADQLDPGADAGWLLALFQELHSLGLRDRLLHISRPLLEKDGALRRRGAPRDVERLAAVALEVARHERDDDLVGYYVLLVGEGHYKRGDHDGAENTFRLGLGFDIGPDRRLQLLRALGQVEYRRGRYRAACDYYEEAAPYRLQAPEGYVATLDHAYAKALFRLGERDRAFGLLQVEAVTRKRLGDRFNELSARHELARLRLEAGQEKRAERELRVVLTLSRAEGYLRFVPPPAYELCKLLLRRGQTREAAVMQDHCASTARLLRDSMWLAFAQLAEGFIAIGEGDLADGLGTVERACAEGRRLGYRQLLVEAHRWLLDYVVTADGADEVARVAALAATDLGKGLPEVKLRKALRYATAPERVEQLEVDLRSDSGLRRLVRDEGGWSCDCALFAVKRRCTHVIALELMFGATAHALTVQSPPDPHTPLST